MPPRFRLIAAAMLFGIAAAASGLWWHTYYLPQVLQTTVDGKDVMLVSGMGRIEWSVSSRSSEDEAFGFAVPYGAIVFFALSLSLLLVPPQLVVQLVVWSLGRRTHLRGSCQNCGYNLTGNTSGVCPECGTPTTRSRSVE